MHFSSFSLAVLDIAFFHLAISVAFWMRSRLGVFDSLEASNLHSYFYLTPWISVIVPLIFFQLDLYDTGNRKRFANFCYSICIAVIFVNVVLMAVAFWNRSFAFPRSVLALSILMQIIFIMAYRYGLWRLVKKTHGTRKVLVVANDHHAGLRVADKFLQHDAGWFSVKAFVSPEGLLADPARLHEADIVLIGPGVSPDAETKLIHLAVQAGKEAMVIPASYHIFLQHSNPQQIADTIVLSIRPDFLSRRQHIVKRMLDLGLSGFALLAVLPLMAVIWAAIRATSPGPALYRQERVGLHGKPFTIYKFRSMICNAEEATGPVLAKDNDARITAFGKLLRATRLDELPQLLNVLKGDMSLVGPRPEREAFTQVYEKQIPDYRYRVTMKPGITGLAQILSNYNTSMEDKVRYDLLYAYNYSFLLDLKILFQTIRVVLQRDSVQGVKEQQSAEFIYGRLGIGELPYTLNHNESN